MSASDEPFHLRNWNRFWLTLFILTWAGIGANWYLRGYTESLLSPRTFWHSEGQISLRASSDGPFVFTHLVFQPDTASGWKIAALNPPLAHIDSHGVVIPVSEVRKLKWLDIFGKTTAAPVIGSPIQALYTRPEKTRLRDEQKQEFIGEQDKAS